MKTQRVFKFTGGIGTHDLSSLPPCPFDLRILPPCTTHKFDDAPMGRMSFSKSNPVFAHEGWGSGSVLEMVYEIDNESVYMNVRIEWVDWNEFEWWLV